MPRVARIVIPGLPHHVTQRGNNRQDVFFVDDDRRVYLQLLHRQSGLHGVKPGTVTYSKTGGQQPGTTTTGDSHLFIASVIVGWTPGFSDGRVRSCLAALASAFPGSP